MHSCNQPGLLNQGFKFPVPCFKPVFPLILIMFLLLCIFLWCEVTEQAERVFSAVLGGSIGRCWCLPCTFCSQSCCNTAWNGVSRVDWLVAQIYGSIKSNKAHCDPCWAKRREYIFQQSSCLVRQMTSTEMKQHLGKKEKMLPLKKLMHNMLRQCSDVPSQTSCTSTYFSSVHVVSVELIRSALLHSEEL